MTAPRSLRVAMLCYFRACVEKPAVSMVLGRLYHEWDRPGYGERLLLPLMTPEGEPQGLLGITVCKLTFDSRLEAEQRARRVTVILPLDGSPASDETRLPATAPRGAAAGPRPPRPRCRGR